MELNISLRSIFFIFFLVGQFFELCVGKIERSYVRLQVKTLVDLWF